MIKLRSLLKESLDKEIEENSDSEASQELL